MADRRKTRRKLDREEQTPCTKEEYAVAKHARFNTPLHEGRMAGMTVNCFIASDAVDCLMDSKWAKSKGGGDSEVVFTDRKSVVAFLNRLLSKGIFHRADRAEKKKDKDKKKKKDDTEDKKGKKDKKTETEEKKKDDKKDEDKKTEEKKEVDKNKKRKFKLNMGEDQRFVDGNSIYVWIYDPIHPKTFTIGLLMLIGAAALCLFPLWPGWMRIGVYYCSLLGASFVGFMLFLIVFRVIVFTFFWVLTFGRHHFWIFPNLTEDVGIIESFRPIFKHETYTPPEEELELEIKKEKDQKKAKEAENGFEMVEKESEQDEEEDDKGDNSDVSESQEEK